ncbi:hypothetical protein DH2020_005100 [Rehmannia glutinosa]|uniref:sucrose-phosphate synthase n=1 Tax=Rehmannia glutinosa TaxID=99300 RepID=A0ABR0XRB1_REHGL
MGGNEWINGYLEAILDSGASAIEESNKAAHAVSVRDRGNFNPTKYFVEEVVTGVDESDLHRTWIKVVATRNTRERSSRLENMCWRIWHLARKKKQLEWEDLQRLATRRWEREQGRKDVTEDMSEDLSEGEKGDVLGEAITLDSPRKKFQRNFSNLEVWSDSNKEKKLYIVLISLHGLVRGENMELGRDSDTGGQIKYVVELARALAKMPGVYRVDLFTRQVSSPEVDWSYGEPTEMLTTDAEDADLGESSGAYIVRIPFGPSDKYLRKELLWPYIPEFVDGALAHILNMSKALGEQIGGGQPVWPYVIHGHYADAGDSAALLSGALNVPMVLTGHSLGRNKLEQLLKQGRQSKEDINSTYRIMRRIEAEELSLDAAELVITSTKQEIDEQWGLYDGFDVKLEKVLRARARRGVNCHGRFMPRMAVIPPGMDFSNVIDQEDAAEADGDLAALTEGHHPKQSLLYGRKDDIDEMTGGNANVLTTVLKLVDKYDLYGQVAFPKHHKQSDVPDIYRLAGKTKAAAHGLPMVATKNGGPVDIHRALNNGLLVDPHDQQAIADALLKLVSEKNLWNECRKNGLKNIHLFSWPEHCRTYLTRVAACRMRHPQWQTDTPADELAVEDSLNDSLRDVLDMSLRLSVDGEKTSLNESLDLAASGDNPEVNDQVKHVLSKMRRQEPGPRDSDADKKQNDMPSKYPILRRRRKLFVIALDCYDSKGVPEKKMVTVIQEMLKAVKMDPQIGRYSGFALSTAMPMPELTEFLKTGNIKVNDFDALICSSGSEVYYPGTYTEEDGKLCPIQIMHRILNIGGVQMAKKVDDMRQKLRMRGLRCHLMYCRNSTRMQVVPLLASRSQALRYLFVRWRLNVANMYVILGETGDTDYEEMISGAHKTLILKDVVEKGSEEMLRTTGSYLRDDIVPRDSPLVAYTNGGVKAEDIINTLRQLSKAGM